MSKFKKGDRVELIEGSVDLRYSKGSSGTITAPDDSRTNRCIVKWDIGSEYVHSIKDVIMLLKDWDD